MSNLFKPLPVGNMELQNRIVMAPLTRLRASDQHVPLPFVAEYYAQRASVPGTLLISEATFIAPDGAGLGNAPGIWNQEQIEAWKHVTDVVHKKGSFMYLQLWALGRAATTKALEKDGFGKRVVGASDVAFEGGETPTPLTEPEIENFIELYRQAALNAIEAGFDGVEIHGANGYMIDQFLQDISNKRTDGWGGSIEKRARFGIEVAKAVVGAVGAERTGIRLSPYSEFQGMKMEDPVPQFSYFVQELKKLNLAYLHVVESRISGSADVEATEKVDFLIDIWANQSPVFIAGGFRADSAYTAADNEYPDKDIAIVMGRFFIANPDLIFRLKNRIDFTPYDRTTFYNAKQEDGYTNWAFSKEFEAQSVKV